MTRIRISWLVPAVLLALVMSSGALAANYAIDWYCISAGGGKVSSASYALNGTLGQSAAGVASSANYSLSIGFWVKGELPPVIVQRIDEAKLLADGTPVSISGKIATTSETDFTGFFYIEEPDRPSGIRVAASVPGLQRGHIVDATGTLDTTAAGERQLVNTHVTLGAASAIPDPLGLNNRGLGGGDMGSPPTGQYGVAGGVGTNTVGLLVTTWGLVTETGAGYVLIDDGSGVTTRVDTSNLTASPTGYVSVTGISSLYKPGTDRLRLILPRDDLDVTPQ